MAFSLARGVLLSERGGKCERLPGSNARGDDACDERIQVCGAEFGEHGGGFGGVGTDVTP